MAWRNFPGPELLKAHGRTSYDTRCSVHWSHANQGYSQEAIDTAYHAGFRWAKMLNVGNEGPEWPGGSCYAMAFMSGIYCISRIHEDKFGMITPVRAGLHTEHCKRYIANAGYDPTIVRPFVQPYNELNLRIEWFTEDWDKKAYPHDAPEQAARAWLGCARNILGSGGIPVTSPLAPGGEWNDWSWWVRFVRELKRELGSESKSFLEQCVIGVHPYIHVKKDFRKLLDWGEGGYKAWPKHDPMHPDYQEGFFAPEYEDSQGWLMYRWYRQWMHEHTGAEMAVVACEGGSTPMQDEPERDEYWRGLQASYVTSMMALMMGDTVTDPDVVEKPLGSPPAWYLSGPAFWTWGEQPGPWAHCDLRVQPATLRRIGEMTIHPYISVDTPPPPIEPEQPPKKLRHLHVEWLNGGGMIQGNLPVGTKIALGTFGNDQMYRVVAGSKRELGEGGWEQMLYGNPNEVLVAAAGCVPLRINDVKGRIPFVTLAPEVVEPEKPVEPAHVWKLRFVEDAKAAKAAGFDPGHATGEPVTIFGSADDFLLEQTGSKRDLLYRKSTNQTYVSLDEK